MKEKYNQNKLKYTSNKKVSNINTKFVVFHRRIVGCRVWLL